MIFQRGAFVEEVVNLVRADDLEFEIEVTGSVLKALEGGYLRIVLSFDEMVFE
jgi:hypothetical protein